MFAPNQANWQKADWPHFSRDKTRLRKAEDHFLKGSGEFVGALKHLTASDQEQLTVDAMSAEAVTTSEIEGEILDRASVQSSIRRHFGLATGKRRVAPAEEGIARMMVDLYRSYAAPLSHEMLSSWAQGALCGSSVIPRSSRNDVVPGMLYGAAPWATNRCRP